MSLTMLDTGVFDFILVPSFSALTFTEELQGQS